MLLLGLLQTLAIMHEKGNLAHGSIALDSILSESSILEFSAFWLIGLSASRDSADELRAAQAQDVRMALHLAKWETRDQDGLADPIIGPLLRELCSKAESSNLSAADAFTAFDSALGSAAVRSPFRSVRFQKTFRLNIVDETYFLKRELAAVARAYFIGEPEKMLEVHKAVMQVKPTTASSHVDKLAEGARISIKDVQTIFDRLSLDKESIHDPVRFQSSQYRTLQVDFSVSYHEPSATWNITQILPTIMPADSWRGVDPERFLDVRGTPALQGSYVDSQTFASACDALNVSRSRERYAATQTRWSAGLATGDVLLVDGQLLRSTAIYRRFSNLVCFGPSAEYTPDQALSICDNYHFPDLRRGIKWLHLPPPSVDALVQGWLAEFNADDCQSLTMSLRSCEEAADGTTISKEAGPIPFATKEMTHEWVEEQAKRWRGSRIVSAADIPATKFIYGDGKRGRDKIKWAA